MWIDRDIVITLRNLVDTFPVLVLTGPRQTGKTSVLQKTFSDYTYISLDSPQVHDAAESRPEEFLGRFTCPVIIDEIQYAPSLFRYIKKIVDERKSERGLFILTGSQSFPLMEAVSESLAGRTAVIPFLGLSFSEWSGAGLMEYQDPSTFLWKGSFPALWADRDRAPNRDRWYQGYVAAYLERDVRNMLNIGSLRDFERFLRAAASRTGQILNMAETGRDAGVSPSTSKQWFSVLQASNQIHLLEPYYRSLGKRITKSPKLYFTDTGLAAYLAGFSSAEALKESPRAGAFWENFVIGQWLRRKHWHSPWMNLWFWQDRTKNEVDLLIESNQMIFPIECKRKERPDKSDLKGIRKLKEMYGETVGPASIASLSRETYDIAEGVTVRPGWLPWGVG